MTKSIITNDKVCYICGTVYNLHLHHIIFGQNRKKSDEDGLVVWLCREHHEGTDGVHSKNGHELDLSLKRLAELHWCDYYKKDIQDFIERYGKNYLW